MIKLQQQEKTDLGLCADVPMNSAVDKSNGNVFVTARCQLVAQFLKNRS